MEKKERIYFPNLDALRFISAISIVIFHTEQLKLRHGGETLKWLVYFEHWANIDVSVFFVLSGFLITFLLLKEKKAKGSINLKDYYIRRTLKIWPLYYTVMILAFFLLPFFASGFYGNYTWGLEDHFWISLVGVIFFLPCLPGSGGRLPESIGPSWTVRVEEAFYLFWPVIIRKSKRFIRTCCIIIVAVLAIRGVPVLLKLLYGNNPVNAIRIDELAKLLLEYRVSCMAIGGIAAYLLIENNQKILNWLFRKDVQIMVYTIFAILLLLRVVIPIANQEFYSVLTAFLILNLAANPVSVIKIGSKWMAYLGSLSYGLYMYHPIMRILSLEAVKYLFNKDVAGWQMEALYFGFTIGSTIIVSMLSYKLLEKPFLNLKKKFSFINSAEK
jgi:peptidoglycan/LPS O-acetylase OafA/YrhL